MTTFTGTLRADACTLATLVRYYETASPLALTSRNSLVCTALEHLVKSLVAQGLVTRVTKFSEAAAILASHNMLRGRTLAGEALSPVQLQPSPTKPSAELMRRSYELGKLILEDRQANPHLHSTQESSQLRARQLAEIHGYLDVLG